MTQQQQQPQSSAEAVFLAALEQPTPQERAGYAEQVCACDEALLRRVRELLSCHERLGGPLDEPCPTFPDALATNGPATSMGQVPGGQVGPYKLVEAIGEGGMGVVWMAQQQEPVRRLVALKVLKPGMDSRQVLARFEQER